MIDLTPEFTAHLTTGLFLPLGRLVLSMAAGLFLAGLVEGFGWTRFMARLASPLARFANLSQTAAASFSLAFFSPASANALLAEARRDGRLSAKELVLSNLFNSSPAYLVHLPTLVSVAVAFLGRYAFVYVSLTFGAAILRTLCTVVAGRLLLPPLSRRAKEREKEAEAGLAKKSWREILSATFKRFRRRFLRLLVYTIPVYCAIFAMREAGWFAMAQAWLAEHTGGPGPFSVILPPEALGVAVLFIAAESGAAFSAASSLLQAPGVLPQQIVLALLLGNILSSPMRAVRHQFPSYAGYFGPAGAVVLVTASQASRCISLLVVGLFYWLIFF